MTDDGLATRRVQQLVPDPTRVLAQLFVPGHDVAVGREGRASRVVEHILVLSDDDVKRALADIMGRFGDRHRNLAETLSYNAERIGNRLGPGVELSEDRWLLLGATFTHEYAVDAAALCNPSAVAAPDQTGTPPGSLRFVLSVRQIGEGHRSSIGFRTGLVDERGGLTIEDPGPFTTTGMIGTSGLDAVTFRSLAEGLDDGTDATGWVLDRLDEHFTQGELDVRLSQLEAQHDTRPNVGETVRRLRALAARAYTVDFPVRSDLAERVLVPSIAVESNGVEDARFVRFVEDDGSVTYYATYTAFDGRAVVQQLLETTDFVRFTSSPLLGRAAANKGLALFPRRIRGRFVALSRYDGARNAVTVSDDLRRWSSAIPLEGSTEVWEAIQVGNCGSPIETDDGWLVLTHGVGPMRTYAIGALLLDLDEPTKVVGQLRQPLLAPLPEEQDGYVPNVVYSCGAVAHGTTLLIPYGISDQRIGFATVDTDELLAALRDSGA